VREDDLGVRLLRSCRIASRSARERVLEPLLADLQFEERRAAERGGRLGLWWVRLRGLLAFGQALVLVSVRDGAQRWAVRREEWQSTIVATALGTGIASAALLDETYRRLDDVPGAASVGTLMMVLPSILCSTLPIGALAGPAFSKRGATNASSWSTPALMAAALAVMTFAMTGWILPASNQRYRERLFALITDAPVALERGNRELNLRQLARREAELDAAGRHPQALPYAVEWHKRIATPASCFALALMGVAIRRRVRWAMIRVPAVMLVIGVHGLSLRWGEQVGDVGQLAPVVAVWAPLILLAGIAAGLAAARPERQVA